MQSTLFLQCFAMLGRNLASNRIMNCKPDSAPCVAHLDEGYYELQSDGPDFAQFNLRDILRCIRQ